MTIYLTDDFIKKIVVNIYYGVHSIIMLSQNNPNLDTPVFLACTYLILVTFLHPPRNLQNLHQPHTHPLQKMQILFLILRRLK